MITHNINKLHYVIHGKIGKLYGIIFQENTTFEIHTDKSSNMKVKIPSKQPLYLLVKLTTTYHDTCPTLPANIYPIGILINYF